MGRDTYCMWDYNLLGAILLPELSMNTFGVCLIALVAVAAARPGYGGDVSDVFNSEFYLKKGNGW